MKNELDISGLVAGRTFDFDERGYAYNMLPQPKLPWHKYKGYGLQAILGTGYAFSSDERDSGGDICFRITPNEGTMTDDELIADLKDQIDEFLESEEYKAFFNGEKTHPEWFANMYANETKRIVARLVAKVGSEERLAEVINNSGLSFEDFVQGVMEHEDNFFTTPA